MRKKRNAYTFKVGKCEGKRPLGTPRHIRIILIMILKTEDGMVWSGFIWLRTGACDINKHSVSTKVGNFLPSLKVLPC